MQISELKPARSAQYVPGQLGLHRESLSQEKKKEEERKIKRKIDRKGVLRL